MKRLVESPFGASLRGNLAFTGFSVGPDHRVIRGLSYVVVDDPERMRRLQIGDAIAISSELGGAAQLAGLSLTREFSLDPTSSGSRCRVFRARS